MNFLISISIIISIFILTSCSESAQVNNVIETEYLSDTLFDYFKNRSKKETNLKLQLARYKTGDLEWITLYREKKGNILADYSLNKKYENRPYDMWSIFNIVRYQGFKRDSLSIESIDEKYFRRAFLEVETNPAKPIEPCCFCDPANLSQVLLSDSSIIFQGDEELLWSSFDSLVTKLLN